VLVGKGVAPRGGACARVKQESSALSSDFVNLRYVTSWGNSVSTGPGLKLVVRRKKFRKSFQDLSRSEGEYVLISLGRDAGNGMCRPPGSPAEFFRRS
jgi:hypothetical protein